MRALYSKFQKKKKVDLRDWRPDLKTSKQVDHGKHGGQLLRRKPNRRISPETNWSKKSRTAPDGKWVILPPNVSEVLKDYKKKNEIPFLETKITAFREYYHIINFSQAIPMISGETIMTLKSGRFSYW